MGRPEATTSSKQPSPRDVRAALLPEDVGVFDREYRQAMRQATEDLDLNPVLALVERWRLVAASSRDPDRHRRMLATAAALERGDPVSTVTWDELRTRLGL